MPSVALLMPNRPPARAMDWPDTQPCQLLLSTPVSAIAGVLMDTAVSMASSMASRTVSRRAGGLFLLWWIICLLSKGVWI